MTIVADAAGPVGYVATSVLYPRSPADAKALNARTVAPVTDRSGTLVGYWALAVGFVPLATARTPGFDIEDYRAKQYDGCEPQIGSGVGEKYPLCPPVGGDSTGP